MSLRTKLFILSLVFFVFQGIWMTTVTFSWLQNIGYFESGVICQHSQQLEKINANMMGWSIQYISNWMLFLIQFFTNMSLIWATKDGFETPIGLKNRYLDIWLCVTGVYAISYFTFVLIFWVNWDELEFIQIDRLQILLIFYNSILLSIVSKYHCKLQKNVKIINSMKDSVPTVIVNSLGRIP